MKQRDEDFFLEEIEHKKILEELNKRYLEEKVFKQERL